MTSVLGDVIEDTGSLPDWSDAAETTTLPDSEDARILQMYRSALASHWACALGAGSTSGNRAADRAYSKAVLTAVDGEAARTRQWLCEILDIDEKRVRESAVAAIDAAERAQERKHPIEPVKPEREREPIRATRPAPIRRWTATELFAWAVANAAGLEQLGELDAAVDEAARLERLSRRGCYSRAKTMAQEPAATHAERYIETYTPDMAAE